jgi:hypothetical protein
MRTHTVAFGVMTRHNLVDGYKCFGRTHRLYFQDTFTLTAEAVYSSETLVTTYTTLQSFITHEAKIHVRKS